MQKKLENKTQKISGKYVWDSPANASPSRIACSDHTEDSWQRAWSARHLSGAAQDLTQIQWTQEVKVRYFIDSLAVKHCSACTADEEDRLAHISSWTRNKIHKAYQNIPKEMQGTPHWSLSTGFLYFPVPAKPKKGHFMSNPFAGAAYHCPNSKIRCRNHSILGYDRCQMPH